MDLSHLHALELRLSHERVYLANARTEQEKALRKVWIAQIEREIAGEKAFLGMDTVTDALPDMSADELLAELGL